MKNLVWLVVAAIIALGGYMLFTGKGPQEVASEASDAINAPAVVEEVTDAAEKAGEAITEVVDDATQSANDAAEDVTE